MTSNDGRRGNEASPIYKIVVEGQLDASWADWFDGLALAFDRDEGGSSITTLTGAVVDHAALHGILARIRD